jgi:hypothetical protein
MNRTQKVIYRNWYSSMGNVQAGDPQGSVLGPLLFLLYEVADNMVSLCRLYADYNSLQQCSDDISLIEQKLNNDLKTLHERSKKWWLKFNPLKTKAILFNPRNLQLFPQLYFDGCQLEYVTQHKHLGILFSSNLGWHDYIDSIVKKAYKN